MNYRPSRIEPAHVDLATHKGRLTERILMIALGWAAATVVAILAVYLITQPMRHAAALFTTH